MSGEKEMDESQRMNKVVVHFCQLPFSLDQWVLPNQFWLMEASHPLGCSSSLSEILKHLWWEPVVPLKAEHDIHFGETSDGQLYSHRSG